MKSIASSVILMLLTCGAASAAQPEWSPEQAEERIRQHRMGDAVVELALPDGSLVSGGTVVQLNQTEHDFHFGGSLTQAWTLHKHPTFDKYLDRFAGLFNCGTLGFYWNWHESREPGTWQLAEHTQRTLQWAKQRGMTVKGHPMMWHSCLPRFVDQEPDVQQIDRYILDHVQMLARDYPQVNQWDLYNEAPGIRLKPAENGARRWMEAMGGAGPITERLMDTVREVQPKGFFMLNHFKHDDPEYHEQIDYCLDHRVPFSAIGIQTHMHTQARVLSSQQTWQFLQEYAKYGKPIHLSEVTILSCEPFKDWRELQEHEASIAAARRARKPEPRRVSTPEGEELQAEMVRDFYTLAFSHPGVEAIVWWSVTDLGAWRGMPAGLVDENMDPKPAYRVLDQLINHQWRTSTELKTDQQGRVSFRGFNGDYRVTIPHGEKQLHGSFRIEKGQTSPIRVTVGPEQSARTTQ